jgi:hypothetical protein
MKPADQFEFETLDLVYVSVLLHLYLQVKSLTYRKIITEHPIGSVILNNEEAFYRILGRFLVCFFVLNQFCPCLIFSSGSYFPSKTEVERANVIKI